MSNINLSAYIEGIGLLGPGLTDWPSSVAMLRGEQPYVTQNTVLPAPALLPAAERRRASVTVKLNLAVGAQATQAAGVDAATLRTVFTSSGADGETCHAICDVLASNDRRISPTRFHNSVHNAASGYWSIRDRRV
jgi:lambda repressor-like predicted transcriptional regulator